MATPIRMKQKKLTKIHLDSSGNQVLSTVVPSSDMASKGVSAQPPNPLTPMETKGLPGGSSVKEAPKSNEPSTGTTLQDEPVQATNKGAMKPSEALEAVASDTPATDKAPQAAPQPVPPGPGDPNPSAPTMTEAKSPNEQKEATTIAPNIGAGKIVGETECKGPKCPIKLDGIGSYVPAKAQP